MPRNRWPAAALVALLICGLLLLCFGCAAVGWLVLRTGWSAGGVSLIQLAADGATLRLFGAEPRTLDPALVEDVASAEYVAHIFGGLVTLDQALRVVPDVAESWDVSPDGRTYTFLLREDVRFHDGREVEASDFKYSLERACDPRTGSTVAGTYLGDIVGAKDMILGRVDQIEGVQVVDPRTLSITIDAPKAYFLAKLTYSTAFVVDRDNVEQAGWLERPNGTGPFKLEDRNNQRIVLARNEHYHRQVPRLERVAFALSGGSPVTMYENGELDAVSVGPGDVERVLDPSNPLNAELTMVPQLSTQYLGLNVTQPPFDDTKVRQAFALAIDRRKITDVVWKGMRVPAQGIVPPGLPGYERSRSLLDYDPPRARRLIAESQYSDVSAFPVVTLRIGGSGVEMDRVTEAIVAMYRENLGIQIEVERLADILADQPQMYALGWIADYPDPEDFLDILFHSASALNHMNYSNSQVDRLLEEARVEQNTQRRMLLYAEAEETIVADAPWVPLWHGVDYVLVKPYVKGVDHAAAIFPWLSGVYLER